MKSNTLETIEDQLPQVFDRRREPQREGALQRVRAWRFSRDLSLAARPKVLAANRLLRLLSALVRTISTMYAGAGPVRVVQDLDKVPAERCVLHRAGGRPS